MPTPAVTDTFLAQCADLMPSASGDGSVRLALFPGVVLWPRVSDVDGSWSFGLASGITMAASALAELQQATANGDGSYTVAGVRRVLNLTAGACEPSGPPPPAP